MTSPITTSTGLGSGLDINSIVSALVDSDKLAAQTQITTGTTQNTASISAVGTLKSAMAAYQTALTTLGSTTTPAFNAFAATSSSSTITATADNTAVAGSYSIEVSKLATASKIASASFSGGSASAISSGTLQISQNGTNYSVAVGSGATLQTVRDSINSSLQSKGITANIITDTSGSRLVLTSSTTGAGNNLTMSGIPELAVDGTTAFSSSSSAGGYITQGGDATLTVDGLSVTSSSNTVSSAIGGISMTLTATNVGNPATVTVATNTSGLQSSLQSFVTAYNTLLTAVNSLTATTTDTDGNVVSGALTGDSLPRSLKAALSSVLTTPSTTSGSLTVLSQLGITTDFTTGQLKFDSTAFSTAMTDKGLGSKVQAMFSGTNGVVAKMTAVLTPYTQTGGILDQRSTQLNKTKSDLADKQTALDLHVESFTATLTAKYNAMDTLVGQMKAQATSITSFFDSLNASKS
ncbi:MAG: flagellar filament capping protein FliD [Janthinobacterium lividum]|uniref:flagellar filament capping protein FliD n=1 Tax=Pseudomonas sp. MWU16-30317 TaxID=2878095 RepID=UPI001CFB1715|nr:flagellar filament capping protein FliD [Pseudomonas sp. MWU16-30317]